MLGVPNRWLSEASFLKLAASEGTVSEMTNKCETKSSGWLGKPNELNWALNQRRN